MVGLSAKCYRLRKCYQVAVIGGLGLGARALGSARSLDRGDRRYGRVTRGT